MSETHTRLTLRTQHRTEEHEAPENSTYLDTQVPVQISRYDEVLSTLHQLSPDTSHVAFVWHHLDPKYSGEQLTVRALRRHIRSSSTSVEIGTFDMQITEAHGVLHPIVAMSGYSLTTSGLYAPDGLRARYDTLCDRLDRQRLGGFDTTIGEFGDSPPAA